jgi:hypothetical protein
MASLTAHNIIAKHQAAIAAVTEKYHTAKAARHQAWIACFKAEFLRPTAPVERAAFNAAQVEYNAALAALDSAFDARSEEIRKAERAAYGRKGSLS